MGIVIAYQNDRYVDFVKSPDLINVLTSAKISARLVADTLRFPRSARIMPYTSFNIAHELHTMGVASYTMGSTVGLSVGNFCSIAGGLVVPGERHPIEDVTSSSILYDLNKENFNRLYRDFDLPTTRRHPIKPAYGPFPIIEDDVWVGQNVTLSRGIRIGTGSVVASCSVVVKDVAPYTIVGGNPAKPIRSRFDAELVEQLLLTRWWKLHPCKLMPLLELRNPLLFIEHFKRLGTSDEWNPDPLTSDSLATALGAELA